MKLALGLIGFLFGLGFMLPAQEQIVVTGEKSGVYHKYATWAGADVGNGQDRDLVRSIHWSAHKDSDGSYFERIEIDFKVDVGDDSEVKPVLSEEPPRFEVVHEGCPERMVLSFSGSQREAPVAADFSKSRLARRSYALTTFDYAQVDLAIEFHDFVEIEIFEQRNPGRIVMDVRKVEGEQELGYVLRTRAMALGEEFGGVLAAFREWIELDGGSVEVMPRQLMTDDYKSYCLQFAVTREAYKIRVRVEGYPEKFRRHFIFERRKPTDMAATAIDPAKVFPAGE